MAKVRKRAKKPIRKRRKAVAPWPRVKSKRGLRKSTRRKSGSLLGALKLTQSGRVSRLVSKKPKGVKTAGRKKQKRSFKPTRRKGSSGERGEHSRKRKPLPSVGHSGRSRKAAKKSLHKVPARYPRAKKRAERSRSRLYVSFGIRVDDAASKSPTLARNRTIFTYYHSVVSMGVAMVHVRQMREKIAKATRVEPHELVARFRASSGDAEYLSEVMNENARKLRVAGYSANARTVRNSDHSIDAEIRIQIYDVGEIDTSDPSNFEAVEGGFARALRAFGDETDFPREI